MEASPKSRVLSAGKLGVTGFCWGGSTTSFLPVTIGKQPSTDLEQPP